MSNSAAQMDRLLEQAGHTRRFLITQASPLGWEVREEADSQVVRSVRYTDWHRVERARTMMGLKMYDLAESGWVEV